MRIFHVATLNNIRLASILGYSDILGRYRRSVIGPFWLTISMGIMIACIGVIFSGIFKADIDQFLPFLAAGFIFWAFISGIISDGCEAFISAEAIIKQHPIAFFVHIMRVVWRNILILAHHIIILPLVFLGTGGGLSSVAFLAIPGFFLVVLCLSWVAFSLAIMSARYRDLPQIVSSILQVGFYITPIIWMPNLLPERLNISILQFNPFYHVIELLRAPFLGFAPSMTSWLVLGSLTVFGWVLTLFLFERVKTRITYWL